MNRISIFRYFVSTST